MSVGYIKDGKLVTCATKDDMAAEAAAREAADNECNSNVSSLSAALDEHVQATTGIHGASTEANSDTLIMRDTYGRARVREPDNDYDIANKLYVDDAITAGVDYTIGSDGTYYVYTVAGLQAWATACESDASIGCVLMKSLDMSGVSWTPVADYVNTSTPYTGIFDGAGHSLRNLTIELSTNYTGFISYLGGNGVVRNLHLVNCSISGAQYTGGIVGYAVNSMISSCTNSNTVTGTGQYTGGIVGYALNSMINSCTSYGNVISSSPYVGGIVGYVNTSSSIHGCNNRANVTVTQSSNAHGYVGGITGYGGQILSCVNSGVITLASTASNYFGLTGGISGGYSNASSCINIGQVQATCTIGCRVGGILGTNGNVYSCLNLGEVIATATSSSGTASAGGIIGYLYEGGSVMSCKNETSGTNTSGRSLINASVNSSYTSTSAAAGGIVGYAYGSSSASSVVTGCVSYGIPTDAGYVGYAIAHRANSTYCLSQYNASLDGGTEIGYTG